MVVSVEEGGRTKVIERKKQDEKCQDRREKDRGQ
jgi:hypothetical protein